MSSQTPYIAGDAGPQTPSSGLPGGREAVAIIIERAWIGILVALAVFMYAWFDVERQTPMYRSTATLIVEAQIPQLADFQQVRFASIRNLEYFNTHLKILHSRRMMQRAIEDGNLAQRAGFTPGVESGPRQIEAALRFVNINAVERTRMIEIRAQHPDPQIAADLANALANAYIQQELDNRMNASLQSVEWLRTRAEDYRARLEEGFLGLQQYAESTQSVSLETDKETITSKIRSLNSSLMSIQTEMIGLRTKLNVIDKLITEDTGWTEVIVVLEDGDAQRAYREWREQERKLEALRQRYLPEHPDYQAALESLDILGRNFQTVSERAVQTMRARYELLRERKKNLQQALHEQEQKAFDLDRKMVRYNDLKRNLEAEEQVYQAIVERMKQTSLVDSLPSELIRVAEEARPARVPFHPNPRRAKIRGGALGLVLGLAAIFGLYFTDHRFRRAEEIERQLNLPVLGTLPLVTAKSFSDRGLVMHRKDTGEAAEAFRTLRAALMLQPDTHGQRCLMVTSAHAGEGKSLVATNLAIAFAQDGQRTLLIGSDMRRPVLHKIFEKPEGKGLTEVLKDGCGWRDVLMECDIPDMDVLSAGHGSRRPAELLGSSRFRDLMQELKAQYDRIIVDAPPIMGISDTLILLSHIDRALCVVRYGSTHSLSAWYAIRKIDAGGVRCAGVILNGVNLRSMANYYYYRRYGGYAYRHYTSDKQKAKSTQGKT